MQFDSVMRFVAQVPQSKIAPDMPHTEPFTFATTWMLIAAFVVGILLMAFKVAKRNNQLEE